MRGFVDCRIYTVDFAGENLAREGINGDIYLVALLYLGVVALGDSDEEFHWSNLLDGIDWLAHGVHVTLVVVPCGHHSFNRRAENGVLKKILVAGLADLVGKLDCVKIRL